MTSRRLEDRGGKLSSSSALQRARGGQGGARHRQPAGDVEGLAIHLNLASGGGAPPSTRGRRAADRQILLNLLYNAVKFTVRGSITLSARSRTTRRPPLPRGVGDRHGDRHRRGAEEAVRHVHQDQGRARAQPGRRPSRDLQAARRADERPDLGRLDLRRRSTFSFRDAARDDVPTRTPWTEKETRLGEPAEETSRSGCWWSRTTSSTWR